MQIQRTQHMGCGQLDPIHRRTQPYCLGSKAYFSSKTGKTNSAEREGNQRKKRGTTIYILNYNHKYRGSEQYLFCSNLKKWSVYLDWWAKITLWQQQIHRRYTAYQFTNATKTRSCSSIRTSSWALAAKLVTGPPISLYIYALINPIFFLIWGLFVLLLELNIDQM